MAIYSQKTQPLKPYQQQPGMMMNPPAMQAQDMRWRPSSGMAQMMFGQGGGQGGMPPWMGGSVGSVWQGLNPAPMTPEQRQRMMDIMGAQNRPGWGGGQYGGPSADGYSFSGTGGGQPGGPNDPRLNPAVNAAYKNGMNGGQGGGMQAPPTGLIGSEQALYGGLQGGMAALLQGMQQGRGDIMGQLKGGLGDLNSALMSGNNSFNQGAGALRGARDRIGNLFSQGIGAGNQYFDQGIGSGNQFFNQGVGQLNPFIDPGMQSQRLQAAMSGALGPAEQQRAMSEFNDSPGQAWLRERGERAVTRNAAATGGLGSGRVLQELQRQGQGLAAQQFDTRFNQLGQLTNQGLSAAGQAAGLRGQQGQMNANMRGQQGMMNANMRGQEAGLQGNMAQALANLKSNQAQFGGMMGSNMANLRQNAGNQLGNMSFMGGQLGANMAYNTGNSLAAGRTAAGNAIANNIAQTTGGLADLRNQQGQGLSNLFGQNAGIIGQLLTGAGDMNANDLQQLAQILSGINMQGAGIFGGVPGMPGVSYTPGMLGELGKLFSGIGNL